MSDKVQYIFSSKVLKVEECVQSVNYRLDENNKWINDNINKGWFILLEGSMESLFVGYEKPELTVGQKVRITIEPL